MSLSFCHDVIVPGRREEYHVWATLRTAMTKDLAMTAALPPYEDIVASQLIKNCLGFECPSYMGSWGGLYDEGHGVAYNSADRGEASSKAKFPWWKSSIPNVIIIGIILVELCALRSPVLVILGDMTHFLSDFIDLPLKISKTKHLLLFSLDLLMNGFKVPDLLIQLFFLRCRTSSLPFLSSGFAQCVLVDV
jgi:hypothetical protein